MKDHSYPKQPSPLSRRLFGKYTIAAATTALQTPVMHAVTNGGPTSELGVRPEGLSVEDWDEVQAKYSNLLRVYGKRLSAEEKHRLIAILTTNQHMLVSIRSFEVKNSDPSACTLRLQT
jgi:hypothetical protein